jgi:hypothetical protein
VRVSLGWGQLLLVGQEHHSEYLMLFGWLQEQVFNQLMRASSPSASAAASVDWLVGSSSSRSGSSSDVEGLRHAVDCMKGTLSDAVANVQRLYDK